MIVAAALRCEIDEGLEVIISAPPPARHHNLLFAHYEMRGYPLNNSKNQGFLTSEGKFVDRIEGMKIVLECNQKLIDHPSRVEGVLYSEDLW
jgi:hypothetical protein